MKIENTKRAPKIIYRGYQPKAKTTNPNLPPPSPPNQGSSVSPPPPTKKI